MKNKLYLSTICYSFLSGLVAVMLFSTDLKGAAFSQLLFALLSTLTAMVGATVFFGIALKNAMIYLNKYNLKKSFSVSVVAFFTSMLIAMLLLVVVHSISTFRDIISELKYHLSDSALSIRIVNTAILTIPMSGALMAFAWVGIATKRLLEKWKKASIKSFRATLTLLSAVIAFACAFLSVAFIKLSVSMYNLPRTVGGYSDSVLYYSFCALMCIMTAVSAVLTAVRLYRRNSMLNIAKRCLVFLLAVIVVGLTFVSGQEKYSIYTTHGWDERHHSFEGIAGLTQSLVGVVKLGLSGEDVICIGTEGDGRKVYLAADSGAATQFIKSEAWATKYGSEFVYETCLPFAGVYRFEEPDINEIGF